MLRRDDCWRHGDYSGWWRLGNLLRTFFPRVSLFVYPCRNSHLFVSLVPFRENTTVNGIKKKFRRLKKQWLLEEYWPKSRLNGLNSTQYYNSQTRTRNMPYVERRRTTLSGTIANRIRNTQHGIPVTWWRVSIVH